MTPNYDVPYAPRGAPPLATKFGVDDALPEVRYGRSPHVSISVDVHDFKAFLVSKLPERTPEGVAFAVTATDDTTQFLANDLTPDDAEAFARAMAHAAAMARRLNRADPATDPLAAMFLV